MASLAYVISQFPNEMFILREVEALAARLDKELVVFSLKPARKRSAMMGRVCFKSTYYPSLRGFAKGIYVMLTSRRARSCAREVLAAYRHRPVDAMKALVTVLLAAAIIPTTRRLQIQHMHAHWATMPALAAYFIKRVCDIPFSVTAHAWDIYMDTTFLRQKLCAAEFVVTCTAANVALLGQLGAPLDRVFLCYHGLDFDLLPRPVFDRSSDLRILSVGRLVEQKGFSDLIKACHLLKQRNLTFRCVIVGAGPLSSKLRDLIAEYGLDHFVELAGSRSQRGVFDAYRWATTLCTPSVIASDGDRDGIPNVIVEAMSQGLPIVASRVSGIPEIVQSNQTGRLVPPGDPVLLAEALEEISRNPEEARRRAVAAYKLVRIQFDAHKNARFLLRLFEASTPVGKASSPLHIDTVLKHTQ